MLKNQLSRHSAIEIAHSINFCGAGRTCEFLSYVAAPTTLAFDHAAATHFHHTSEMVSDKSMVITFWFGELLDLDEGAKLRCAITTSVDISGWTLDLSPYIWSGTLKDLRSWAVLSLAIENKINHLAVWTAGNAGLSLAKLVHRWNAAQRSKELRKTVHCLVDAFAPPEIVVTLRALQCSVAPISTGSGTILSREQVYHVVASLAKMKEDYWQVTDGWDGVGTFMYSLLARQCLYSLGKRLEAAGTSGATNIYIVVPLGTGNLLFGFVRGIEETSKLRPKLVAALPYGDNMMTPFLGEQDESNHRPRMRRVAPVAPKLTGFYSPLSPCLWHLALNRDFSDPRAVEFIEVDRASQIEAASHVFSLPRDEAIASEPSALIAFGALKQLEQRIREHGGSPETSAVLVVNSGFGIMGEEEEEFYTKSIFAFR